MKLHSAILLIIYSTFSLSEEEWAQPIPINSYSTSCSSSRAPNQCDPSRIFDTESEAFNYAANNVLSDLESRVARLVGTGPIERYSALDDIQAVYRYHYQYQRRADRPDISSYLRVFVVAPAGGPRLMCPGSHPLALDENSDGTPELCIKRERCPIPAESPQNDEEGNPISCSSGEKIQREPIYSGSGPDPLNYSTYYSSPKYNAETDQRRGFSSSFGSQRSDNQNRKLEQVYNANGIQVYRATYKNNFSHVFYGSTSSTILASNFHKSGSLSINNGEFSQTTPNGTTYIFNATGQLTSRVLANGQVRTYTYTTSGKLSVVTNHFGKQLRYFYNSSDLLNKLTTPDNQDYLFDYDVSENLVKITYPDSTPLVLSDNPYVEFLFEDSRFPNNLTGKLNEKGIRFATWAYDEKGRAISSEHSASLEKVELDYSIGNQARVKRHVSGTLSNEVIYHYVTRYFDGSRKQLLTQYEQLACTDCEIGSWHYEYDSNGFVEKSTSPTGNITLYDHDDKGLENSRTEAFNTPQQKTTTTLWNSSTRRPTSITSGKLKTEYLFNSLGQKETVTLTDLETFETRVNTFTYNTDSLLDTVNGPLVGSVDTASFGYDVNGNLNTITNALNQITTLTNYDANGRVGTITDSNGTISTLTYTPRGWLETSTTNGALTQYEYYPTGSVKKVTSPNGQTINYEYDDGERLEAIVDTLGNRIEYVRDLMGNVTENKTKDPNGIIKRQQTAVFNALGQLKQSLGNNGQSATLTYDADGLPETNKNAKNDTMTSNYDALNRLIKNIDPDNGETNYGYDDNDHLTTVTDAEGKLTSYEYNAFGEVTKLTSPDTGITSFTYDKAGNLLTKTDARNETTTFTYDALNRVKTQSYSDSSENIVYTYDDTTNGNKGIGRLTSVTDQSGSTGYVYNAFGQVTKETQIVDGKTYITEYHFDANGQMTGMTYPNGRQIDYTFDGLARVSGITTTQASQTKTLASSISYLPFGPMESVTYGNAKVLTQSFDLDYRLTDKTTSGIHQITYGYDLTNNIDTITNGVNTSESQTFSYDKLSRLLTADGGYGNLGFTYDKVGNRLTKTDNTNVDTYAYDASSHKLTGITGTNPTSFTHDAIGNTLTKDGLTFAYNKQARLKSASKVGMNAAYVYNFKGQRVSKQVDGVTTHFVYDLNGQLISEADNTGAITKEYVYLNGQRHSVIEGSNTYYVHTDHLGTPIALSDDAGVVQWKAHYTPFGKAIIDVNNLTQNIRFPGQYFDAESGLHYNYFRDYDPEIGRYIQSDPIGLNGGINTYGYVGGNPVNAIDPYGLELILVGQSGGAGNLFRLAAQTYNSENCDCNEIVEVGSGEEFVQAIESYALRNNGVDGLQYFGHSNNAALFVDQGAETTGSLYGSLWLRGNSLPGLPPVVLTAGADFTSSLTPSLFNAGAQINLRGCNAGFGNNSIASELARLLGVTVTASTGPTNFSAVPNGAPGEGWADPTRIPSDYNGPVYMVPEYPNQQPAVFPRP